MKCSLDRALVVDDIASGHALVRSCASRGNAVLVVLTLHHCILLKHSACQQGKPLLMLHFARLLAVFEEAKLRMCCQMANNGQLAIADQGTRRG
jgi:hypothetical protein